MTTTTYELLDQHEVESVRALRRRMWRTIAENDPPVAADQARKVVGSFTDAWADNLHVDEIVAACLAGVRLGDLTPTKRYALVSLIEKAAA